MLKEGHSVDAGKQKLGLKYAWDPPIGSLPGNSQAKRVNKGYV